MNVSFFFCFVYVLHFLFPLQGPRTSAQRPSTETVFVLQALIRDQHLQRTFSQRKLTLLSSHTTFNEAGLRARPLDRRFVSVKTCRDSVYCLVGGMIAGKTPTLKSGCKNLIAGTTCIPRRSLLHISRKSRKKQK